MAVIINDPNAPNINDFADVIRHAPSKHPKYPYDYQIYNKLDITDEDIKELYKYCFNFNINPITTLYKILSTEFDDISVVNNVIKRMYEYIKTDRFCIIDRLTRKQINEIKQFIRELSPDIRLELDAFDEQYIIEFSVPQDMLELINDIKEFVKSYNLYVEQRGKRFRNGRLLFYISKEEVD